MPDRLVNSVFEGWEPSNSLGKQVPLVKKYKLKEPFEPVLRHFTDRADPRGLLASAKIPADPAAPDGKGKYR